jgi:hypothetical protein
MWLKYITIVIIKVFGLLIFIFGLESSRDELAHLPNFLPFKPLQSSPSQRLALSVLKPTISLLLHQALNLSTLIVVV